MKRLSLIAALAVAAVGSTYADPPRQATPNTPFRLQEQDLGVMLKDLKYETALVNHSYEIEMRQGTYTFHPLVGLSTSGNKIWITTSVRPLAATDMGNADMLSKLLMANNTVGPAQFYIENVADKGKAPDYRLGFGYPLDNRGVTEEVLKDALDAFANNLVDESSIWDTTKGTK